MHRFASPNLGKLLCQLLRIVARNGSLLRAHPGGEHGKDRKEEETVANEPHDGARELLIFQRCGPPRPLQPLIVRIEHARRPHDRHPKEAVLRHLRDQIEECGGAREAVPHWVEREDWGPEEERAAEVDRVLQVVQEGIIERRIKEWREVRCPHHKHKEEPGNDRVTNDTNQATLQQRQDPRAPVW